MGEPASQSLIMVLHFMTRGGKVITNALGWEGWIPIYYVAYHNYASSIGVLLENGAGITISVFLTSYIIRSLGRGG